MALPARAFSSRLVVTFLALACAAAPLAAQTRLLRFPDIHGDKVVFTYAGDLWSAPAAGGTAVRLTAHPGVEVFAKFSPDGRSIAFTGQYDGDEQVYVIPAGGGVPRQLTFYPARGPLTPRWGYDNQVVGWTRDGKSVLFRSLRDGWDLGDSRLYTVPAAGGAAEPLALAMPVAGSGSFSPDGTRIAYTPHARDFRTWKRYQGGWAQDIWIFDLATAEARNITDNPFTDRDPMWIGDTIFFSSDRTGTLNLYAYDTRSGATRQLTHSTQWDVRWPSADQTGRIVYELAGELHVYDTRAGSDTKLSIEVPTDALDLRPSRVSAANQIEDGQLSPKGERALLVARGDIFSVPIEKGVTRNLTHSSNAHERGARWSPDGGRISFISDRDGEDEIYLMPQDGSGPAEQLTHGNKARLYDPQWSPDGKRLAWSDKDGHLRVLTLEGRKIVEVARERRGDLHDYTWSPCGGHLAFTLSEPSGFYSIWLWSVEDGKLRRITEGANDGSPAWDPHGSYLYFLSNRSYSPQIDGVDFDYALDRATGIFALALRRNVAHPFPLESDEVTVVAPKTPPGTPPERGAAHAAEKSGETKEHSGAAEPEDGIAAGARDAAGFLRIDFDGLGGRVARVPVEFENYGGLAATAGYLVYTQTPPNFYGRDAATKPTLRLFSLTARKETTLAEGAQGFALSRDGNKAIVAMEGNQVFLYDVKPEGKDSRKQISTGGLVVDRVPAEEWAEIFDEAWRRYRDFFYVPTMNGYDWEALRRQYRPLLKDVGHRSDLNYLIGEMIAELNSSHAYVAGGDFQLPPRPQVALPGARFELDRGAGRYRIARILRGDNSEDRYRSPLTEIGVDVKAGDYVLAIDGEELKPDDDPYRLLRYKADRPVRLTVNGKPSRDGAREVTFRPIASETALLYYDWAETNRQRVEKSSGGRLGYIHIPDMGEDGLREFIKGYYRQTRKEGLLIDVRSNGGGNVSPMLIERLRRTVLSVDFARTSDEPETYPRYTLYGPMVCLMNETTSSDGDIFSAMFRAAGLGPLIGKRTWGGVVGYAGRGPLMDGGELDVPESGTASLDGHWIIEGHGVDPDIDVDNDPRAVIQGRDPQLERAISELLKRVDAHPQHLPAKPPGPDKTPKAG